MDIFSHGLWGGIMFGRKNRRDFISVFIISLLPDIISFGPSFILMFLGLSVQPDWSGGPPPLSAIPSHVFALYNVTHSFLIFFLVFLFIWALRKKPFWPLGAWGLHILIDIPSHSFDFFPTPFLWPLSDFKINGLDWFRPVVFFPNLILLVIFYSWFLIYKKIDKIKKIDKVR